MFQIEYSSKLKGEIIISGSKNAALPIVAANFCIDNAVKLLNKPNIKDVLSMESLATSAIAKSKDYFDLTDDLAKKFRASILLIPFGLIKYGKVKFVGSGGCNIGKRPLDMFDDALVKAGIKVTQTEEHKMFEVVGTPKKNIMLQGFSVTAIEALLTYLAFANNFDYEINIYQVAIEPHVRNLIDFLNSVGANIHLNVDHSIVMKPSKIAVQSSEVADKKNEFTIIADYIEAGTYFAIGAGADDSELTIKGCDVDDLSALYSVATKIGIDFKIIDKYTIKVNSKNKKNYQAVKFETRTYPGFPTDLQSIFGTLLTQASGISKIFETLYEGRFNYLTELENLGAKIEILNPHEAIVIGPTKLKGGYVSSTDLRCGGAMILAGIMAQGTTNIMNEDIIARGYDDIIHKLQSIGVNIKTVS
ncbi:MAG: UDP-N-acetylglucosamine 1-carboxyvinyltransferase [candidate division SR1 bacterium]|nr:UDP-N-acetylglucosamine 1-carboxyvinyltransferase [candidate division SR1 bacterium]